MYRDFTFAGLFINYKCNNSEEHQNYYDNCNSIDFIAANFLYKFHYSMWKTSYDTCYNKKKCAGGIPMIREICKDEFFLSQKAEPAMADDLSVAQDLLDTLTAHKDGCVGMAANMIGVNKRIIAFDNGGEYMVMFNPVIVKKSAPYDAEEGCLSLTGTRKTKRYQTIKVQWQNEQFQTRIKTFTGWAAQIIQHEIDHCEGILI